MNLTACVPREVMTMKLRLTATLVLCALLAAGGAARAQRPEAETLTPEERREAGEFLLRLDERWREARDFGALFDDAFVGDFAEIARAEPLEIPFASLDKPLREQLTAAEWKRAHVAGLDFIYVAGRVSLAFELAQKNREAAKRAAAASRQTAGVREPRPADEEDAEPTPEEIFSPAVFEVFRGSPLLAEMFPEECDGGDEQCAGGDIEIKTHEQLGELLSTLERATPKMRARVRELEAELGGAPVSAVSREDEGEGEWPDLSLSAAEAESKNRPAGTRVVCGYVSLLQVCSVKEGGRYKVLAAYMLAD